MTRAFAWILVAVSAFVAWLAIAPFTGAVLLVAVLLPLAAFNVWSGLLVPGLAATMLCALALYVSPMPFDKLWDVPLFAAPVALGFAAVAAGVMRRMARSRGLCAYK